MTFLIEFNLNILLLAISLSLLLLIIIVLIIIFIVVHYKENKFNYLIKDSCNSIRVYVLDLANDKVEYFNRSNLKKRYSVPLVEFYNHFQSNEQEDIINWIQDLIDKEKEPSQFKEAHVISMHRKANFYCLLQVEKINYKEQLIYLDSFLIKTTAEHKNVKDNSYKFVSSELFSRLIANSSSQKGITFAFNFYDKRDRNEEIPRLTFLQFVNIFNDYITNNRPMIEYGTHQIVVSDLHIYSRQQVLQLIMRLKSDLNTHLMISSMSEKIGYTIGIVINKNFPRDAEKLISNATTLAESALDEEEEIMWYEKGRKLEGNDQESYRTEVERIIRDKRIKYSFRPIINLDKVSILGYQSFAEPEDGFFGSIKELKNYALRTEDDRALFATIARNTITRFAQEKDGSSLRLFFPINNLEKNYVNRTLSHIQNIKEIHIVLIYSEDELTDLPENGDDALVNEIRLFKSRGYEIALEITDNDLTLSSNVYGSFDYFMVDVNTNLKIGNKYSQHSLLAFRGLVEKLLKYHHPIIALDVPSWDSVELIDKLGISMVSSDVIAMKSENVLPIPQKSLIRIKNIKK